MASGGIGSDVVGEPKPIQLIVTQIDVNPRVLGYLNRLTLRHRVQQLVVCIARTVRVSVRTLRTCGNRLPNGYDRLINPSRDRATYRTE